MAAQHWNAFFIFDSLRPCTRVRLSRGDGHSEHSPLRQRRENIIPLAHHFVGLTSKWSNALSGRRARLLTYHWPGNVRELRSVIEQAVIFAMGIEIQADELTFSTPAGGVDANFRSMADVEMRHILQVMRDNNQNKSDAAKILKMARSTLLLKLKSYENQLEQ